MRRYASTRSMAPTRRARNRSRDPSHAANLPISSCWPRIRIRWIPPKSKTSRFCARSSAAEPSSHDAAAQFPTRVQGGPLVDAKFQALLTHYHARMAEEDRVMKSDPAGVSRRRDEFLLAVGPEVAQLLHALIIGRGAKRILELGTSYGYSTAFLADAARQTGGRVYTMDLAPNKQQYARTHLEQ